MQRTADHHRRVINRLHNQTMAYFDPARLTALIDAKGIAGITHPGPPYTVWQLAEVNAQGNVMRRSSRSQTGVLQPIFKARSMHWMPSVQYVGDGEVIGADLEAMAAVATAGINALFAAFPLLGTLDAGPSDP